MGGLRLTLDSNILVYAVQRGDRRHDTAAALLRRATRADCVQTMQSMGECFNALRGKRGFGAREACHIIEDLLDLFPIIVAAEHEDLREALRASAAHGFQFWDAMLWATARRVGCAVIVTEDVPGLPDLDGVTFVNPFDAANERLMKLLLPPLE